MPKKSINKPQPLSTHDELMLSMSPQEKKEYYEGYRNFLLSELLITIKQNDTVTAQKLAKHAGITSEMIKAMQAGNKQNVMMHSFFNILKAFDCSIDSNKDIVTISMRFEQSIKFQRGKGKLLFSKLLVAVEDGDIAAMETLTKAIEKW